MAQASPKRAETSEVACLLRDEALARADLEKAERKHAEHQAKLARLKSRFQKADLRVSQADRETRSKCQQAKGKGPRTKAARACAAAKAQAAVLRTKRQRAGESYQKALERALVLAARVARVSKELARVRRLLGAEKARQTRVDEQERLRQRYRELQHEQQERKRLTPRDQQDGEPDLPPLPRRRYSREDERFLSEQVEAQMREVIEPCAEKTKSLGHVYRYCESNDVDGRILANVPMLWESEHEESIDPDDLAEDDFPFSDPAVVVKDVASCVNASRLKDWPWAAEAFYQVGWVFYYPTGKLGPSKGDRQVVNAQLPSGQNVEIVQIASHWFRGEWGTAFEMAPDMLFNQGRGFLEVNANEGMPVRMEFYFYIHWGPDEKRPPKKSHDGELWDDLVDVSHLL